VEQKKAYNFQLKILQAPGTRQEAKREQREEEHQSRGGSKARELGCQGRKEGAMAKKRREGQKRERERGSEQTTVDKRDHPFLDQ
jgi:hypothetical protein